MNSRFTIIAIWTMALACCVFIIKLTAIGPVILVISERLGMGVHVGDLLILLPLIFAVTLTIIISRPELQNDNDDLFSE